MNNRLMAVLAVSLSLGVVARAQEKTPATGSADAPQAQAGAEQGAAEYVTPLQLVHGRPVVEVSINGKGPFKMVLDTGAGQTVLDERLRAELHIEDLGPASITGPDGKVAEGHRKIRIAEMRLGPARVADFEAGSADFSQMFRDPDGPRGVLDGTAFPGSVVTIDYPRTQLRVAAGSLPAADGVSIFNYELMDDLPAVAVTIADMAMRLHVDTGSPAGITLGAEFMKKLPLSSEPEVIGRARLVSGEVQVWGARLKGNFRMGAATMENPDVEFLESVPYGNLGYRFLRDFAISIDAAKRRIRFAKS